MKSPDSSFECEGAAGVTDPVEDEPRRCCAGLPERLPDPRGVNVAAAAALGEMPTLTGTALPVFGVKEGDSTLRDFFELGISSASTCFSCLLRSY